MDEVERLREENERLRRILNEMSCIQWPPEWKLSPMEGRLLSLIYSNREISYRELHEKLYFDVDPKPEMDGIKVMAHRAKHKIPFSAFETRWGHGFYVTDDQLGTLRGYARIP